MANKAPIINVSQNAIDHHAIRPRVILAVYPFEHPEVNFKKIVDAKDQEPDTDKYTELEKNVPIIITDDCVNLQVRTGKADVSHHLNATLVPGDEEYLGFLDPGDYVYAWIVNSPDTFDKVLNALKNGSRANFYDSGLVFFGQVDTITENFAIDPLGTKQFRFSLSASGFKPYLANIMWTPFVYSQQTNVPSQAGLFNDFVAALNTISKQPKNANQYDIQNILLTLHKLFIGGGFVKFGTKGDSITNKISKAFTLPSAVASVLLTSDELQTSSENKQYVVYSDLINCLFGIQKYGAFSNNDSNETPDNSAETSFGPFNFDLVQEYGNYYVSGNVNESLRGAKVVNAATNLNGVISGLLKEYSNILINELYFTLRPDPKDIDGRGIRPTLIIRQIPFTKSTDLEDLHVTYFTELPRFIIDSSIIKSYSFSKSDSLRINTLRLQPGIGYVGGGETVLKGTIKASEGFLQDIGDVSRNGLKIFESTLSSDVINKSQGNDQDINQKANGNLFLAKFEKYLLFLADVWQNLHLKLCGTIDIAGTDIPICIGENAQIGRTLFHIETVSHNYSIDPDGTPHYMTNLELSHGIILGKDDDTILDSFDSEAAKKFSLADIRGFSEGIIKESSNNIKKDTE